MPRRAVQVSLSDDEDESPGRQLLTETEASQKPHQLNHSAERSASLLNAARAAIPSKTTAPAGRNLDTSAPKGAAQSMRKRLVRSLKCPTLPTPNLKRAPAVQANGRRKNPYDLPSASPEKRDPTPPIPKPKKSKESNAKPRRTEHLVANGSPPAQVREEAVAVVPTPPSVGSGHDSGAKEITRKSSRLAGTEVDISKIQWEKQPESKVNTTPRRKRKASVENGLELSRSTKSPKRDTPSGALEEAQPDQAPKRTLDSLENDSPPVSQGVPQPDPAPMSPTPRSPTPMSSPQPLLTRTHLKVVIPSNESPKNLRTQPHTVQGHEENDTFQSEAATARVQHDGSPKIIESELDTTAGQEGPLPAGGNPSEALPTTERHSEEMSPASEGFQKDLPDIDPPTPISKSDGLQSSNSNISRIRHSARKTKATGRNKPASRKQPLPRTRNKPPARSQGYYKLRSLDDTPEDNEPQMDDGSDSRKKQKSLETVKLTKAHTEMLELNDIDTDETSEEDNDFNGDKDDSDEDEDSQDEDETYIDKILKFIRRGESEGSCQTKHGQRIWKKCAKACKIITETQPLLEEVDDMCKYISKALQYAHRQETLADKTCFKEDALYHLSFSLAHFLDAIYGSQNQQIGDSSSSDPFLRIILPMLKNILSFYDTIVAWRTPRQQRFKGDRIVRDVQQQCIAPLRMLLGQHQAELSHFEKAEREERARQASEARQKREEEEAQAAQLLNFRRERWRYLHIRRQLCETSEILKRRGHLFQGRNFQTVERDANGEEFEREPVFRDRATPFFRRSTDEEEWTDEQMVALEAGLAKYAGEYNGTSERAGHYIFENVFQEYCRPGGVLRDFNVTEITSKAASFQSDIISICQDDGLDVPDWVSKVPILP